MFLRSAAKGQEVNSRNADEVFPEHGREACIAPEQNGFVHAVSPPVKLTIPFSPPTTAKHPTVR